MDGRGFFQKSDFVSSTKYQGGTPEYYPENKILTLQ